MVKIKSDALYIVINLIVNNSILLNLIPMLLFVLVNISIVRDLT